MGDKLVELLPNWAKVVCLVGFPTFVAAFYMGRDAGWIPSPATAMATELHEHVQNDGMKTELLRQICINTTPAGNVAKCFPEERK